MPFEKQPFNESPAGAREFLAARKGPLAGPMISEAGRVAAAMAHWDESTTSERRSRNMGAIRRAIGTARQLIPLIAGYAPRIVDPDRVCRDLEFLIAVWESILPRRGRPLDVKTGFAKLMLAWAEQAHAGPLSHDEVRAAAIAGNLDILPSDRSNRDTWRKAVDAGKAARAADRARFQGLSSARRRVVGAGPKSKPLPPEESTDRTQVRRNGR